MKEKNGIIRIDPGVIATIARKAASGIEGVSRIAGNPLVDNIAEIVGSKRIQDRSILVRMSEESVSVEISINLFYGAKLPSVAAAVQETVSKEIVRMTGLKVKTVNVVVCEIDDRKDEFGK